MDAIEFLKQEHEKAKTEFQRLEKAPAAQRGTIWQKLERELKLHEQKEERYLYGPVSREAEASTELRAWQDRHHGEVEEAEELIGQIDRLSPESDEWLRSVKQLRSTLEQHIATEEDDIWPEIQDIWGPRQREEAGQRMAATQPSSPAGAR
jgi:iron-sulfur cluster repair protein YtfE (RIC family)